MQASLHGKINVINLDHTATQRQSSWYFFCYLGIMISWKLVDVTYIHKF